MSILFLKAEPISIQQVLYLDDVFCKKRVIAHLLVREVAVDGELTKIGDLYGVHIFTGCVDAK